MISEERNSDKWVCVMQAGSWDAGVEGVEGGWALCLAALGQILLLPVPTVRPSEY